MNNQVNNNDSDSKKIFTMLVMIFTLMVCTTGATYAYFAISATNNVATGTAATVGLNLNVTRVLPISARGEDDPSYVKTWNESTQVMVPQLDDYLSNAMTKTQVTESEERINKCVDTNGNVVCQVYEIKVTNASTAAVKVNGTIQFLAPISGKVGDNTFTNLYWRKITDTTTLGENTSVKVANSDGGAITSSTTATDCSTSGNHCSQIYDISAGTVCTISSGEGCTVTSLAVDDSATFYVIIWIKEINAAQNDIDKGTWVMSVNFKDSTGNGVTSTITS